jgi:hypothetical protein
MQVRWRDPAHRVRMSVSAECQWQDPDYRARMEAVLAENRQWQDPAYRARVWRPF